MDDHGLGSPEPSTTVLSGMRDDNINISDVIAVLETDPDYNQSNMFNGGSEISHSTGLPAMNTMPTTTRPKVKIIEQPASKALRFRYECEGRSAGSIPGVSSTPESKTFPAIQIEGYRGRAVVVVSCVTKDPPYRPHPHNLVGREGCKKGVCTLEVNTETMSVTFSNLGIQCVKKKDIEAALRVREDIRVDPFRVGFAHRNQPTSIDLNAVRLCFQVFLEGEHRGKFTVPLTPVVSEPIYDKKAMCDLVIVKLSDCVSSVDGGRKDIILLCEKVAKEDIQIRFYEEQNGQVVWEGFGDFQPSQVHKQTAIWFRAPRYKTLDVTEPVKVFIQLRRPSDGATSEPLPFELLPLDSEPGIRRKRQKFESDPKNHMLLHLQEQEQSRNRQGYNMLNIPVDPVKIEPRDTTPSPYGGQVYGGISPMYTPNPAVSPQYQLPLDPSLGSNPPPTEIQFHNIGLTTRTSFNPNTLPSMNNMMQQNWNIVNADVQRQDDLGTNASSAMNIDTPSGLSSLLDMDSQQLELKQITLNSGELANLNAFDTNHLSESLSTNLSLTDITVQRQDNIPNLGMTARQNNLSLMNMNLPMQNAIADNLNPLANINVSRQDVRDHLPPNLPLIGADVTEEDTENMTDSFTRLTNKAIDSICRLNDMYKPPKKEG